MKISSKEIKQLRNELGWSQAKLGKYLGYNPTTINAWEHGTRPPEPMQDALLELRSQLNQVQEEQKQKFIQGLTVAAATGGFVALMFYLANQQNDEN